MSQSLRDKGRIPYGGQYKLERRDLGLVGMGTSFGMLMDVIRRYRTANGLPNGLGLEGEVEQALCEQYPRECHNVAPESVPSAVELGWRDVLSGTEIMVRQRLGDAPLVGQGEADRRAAICAGCPWLTRVKLPCSYFCGELEKAVRTIIGAKETASQPLIDRKACAICHCFVGAAVWVDLGLQQSVLSEELRGKFREAVKHWKCWKAEGL